MSGPSPASGWVEVLDPNTGRKFYANPATGETTWNVPDSLKHTATTYAEDEWWELYDEVNKLPYYFHKTSGETSWVKPAGVVPIAISAQAQAQNHAYNTDTVRTNNLHHTSLSYSASPTGTPLHHGRPSTVALPNVRANMQRSYTTTTPLSPSSMHLSSSPPSGSVDDFEMRREYTSNSPSSPPSKTKKKGKQEQSKSAKKKKDDQKGQQMSGNLLIDINKFRLEGYAKKYFATQKKGLFRRRVPVKDLLQYSKDPIPTSLLKLSSEDMTKDAKKIFRTILMYMGDKPSTGKGSQMEIAQQIIGKAISTPELRDEVYCQLCKQTCNNPNREHNIRGWELFCMATQYFSPTKDLEAWLSQYLQEHLKLKEQREERFASFCLKKLTAVCAAGTRRRVPTIPELERAKDAPFLPTVFGVTLEEVMELQKETLPHLLVPYILVTLIECVMKIEGYRTEGIFRVPGDTDAVYALKLQFEQGNYDMSDVKDPHVPASLLKLWLRELAEPVIPSSYYDECVKNSQDPDKSVAIMRKLPKPNREIFVYIINFLQTLAKPEYVQLTKMSISNLSMVFAPNFLRCPWDNPQKILDSSKTQQQFIVHAITYYVN